jgi:hypothetical protein
MHFHDLYNNLKATLGTLILYKHTYGLYKHLYSMSLPTYQQYELINNYSEHLHEPSTIHMAPPSTCVTLYIDFTYDVGWMAQHVFYRTWEDKPITSWSPIWRYMTRVLSILYQSLWDRPPSRFRIQIYTKTTFICSPDSFMALTQWSTIQRLISKNYMIIREN